MSLFFIKEKKKTPSPSLGSWMFTAERELLDSALWQFKGIASNQLTGAEGLLGVLRNVWEGEVRMKAVRIFFREI